MEMTIYPHMQGRPPGTWADWKYIPLRTCSSHTRCGYRHRGELLTSEPQDVLRAISYGRAIPDPGSLPSRTNSLADNVNLNPMHRSGDATHKRGPWSPLSGARTPPSGSGATATDRARVDVSGTRQRQESWWSAQRRACWAPQMPGTEQVPCPHPPCPGMGPVLVSWGRCADVHKRGA